MNSILLIGDMINDLIHADGPNKYGEELERRNVIANTAAVIAKARAAGVPIGYIQVGFSPDYRECPPGSKLFGGAKKNGLFKLGGWGTEVHPDLAPEDGDVDIVKHRVSPFYGTDLEPLRQAIPFDRRGRGRQQFYGQAGVVGADGEAVAQRDGAGNRSREGAQEVVPWFEAAAVCAVEQHPDGLRGHIVMA